MHDAAAMAERHAAILGRLAEVGERLAMKHAERALATDDPVVEASATAAFHRAARSVRQCLALEAKLARDAARADREDRDQAARGVTVRRDRRRDHVREAVARLIWTEAEDDIHAELLEVELDMLLELEQLPQDEAAFAQAAPALIARLCRELGLSSPEEAEATEAPRPPHGNGASPDYRSSA